MKHIKQYEEHQESEKKQAKYTIGRYVYLKNTVKKSNEVDWTLPYAKLLDAHLYMHLTPDYQAEYLDQNKETHIIYALDEEDIIRYLTDEEIEKYKLIQATKKYNL